MKTNPFFFNPLNPELNPTCHLLALLGAHHILHGSRIRVNVLNYMLNKINMDCVQDDVYTFPSTTIMVDSISHT